jgi:undecaprenyl-diphosphatase
MDRIRQAMGRHWSNTKNWLARADFIVLLSFLVVVSAGWLFLEIADAVTEGEHGHTDEWILRSLRKPDNPAVPIGPRVLAEGARDITALGGYPVLTLLIAGVVGYQLMARHYGAALLVLIATLGGLLLSHSLKAYYARPRPDLVPHLASVTSPSFPSGHAMLSAVVYLTLGAMLARIVEGRWARLYFLAVAIFLALLVGVSRVFLGVHYPTDVLAGWSAGFGWSVLCWLVARQLQRRGMVEGDIG